jgi:uncharacterized membrane protein
VTSFPRSGRGYGCLVQRDSALPQILLGAGLGGFADGIVLHQVLQWHHMLSSTGEHPVTSVGGLEANTLADGLFHLAAWVAVLVAAALLVRAWQRGDLAPPWGRHVGLLLVGWGLFNLIEGTVNHLLLGIHHVREGQAETTWDVAFLALAALQVAVGALLARRRTEDRLAARSPIVERSPG